ncbi:MAG: hypothetical protein LBC41_01740 [Clostridiales bacterium]|jgi:hypothetical protein|nr:hypothetical protein [Clostridiales bacterium]
MSYYCDLSGENSASQEFDEPFAKWVETVAQSIPVGTMATNFNIYEEPQGACAIQLIASENFDENDYDWACDPAYSSGENIFVIPGEKCGAHWTEKLAFISCLIKRYLSAGEHAPKLKSYGPVCAGFVDGDIDVLYQKPSELVLE